MAAAAIPIGMMVVGSLMKGKADSDALGAQADQADMNARMSVEQAQYNAQKQMVMAGKKIGSATAAYSASGIDTNYGSAEEVLRSSAMNAEMDRQNILHGGAIRAALYHSQADMDRQGANNTMLGSIFSAGGQAAMYGSAIASRGSGASASAEDSSYTAGGEGHANGYE